MKTIIILFFATFISWAALSSLSAQPEDRVSRYYTMKDGLSNDISICMLHHSQGFLWIGTAVGLNRFDGYQFTAYLKNTSDPDALCDNWIVCLWEDQQERIWVGTDKGLDVFDPKTEKFHHIGFPSPDTMEAPVMDVHVNRIKEKKDGKVWLCTYQGIYVADPLTLSVTKWNNFHQSNSSNSFQIDSLYGIFWNIAEAQDGSVWATAQNGLVHWDAFTSQTTLYQDDPENPQTLPSKSRGRAVYIDHHGRVWTGNGKNFYLDLFNPDDQSFIHYLPEELQSDNSLRARFGITELSENHDGKILIGVKTGLYEFDPDTEKFKKFDLLEDQNVWSVLQDRQGSIWAGSFIRLNQIQPHRKKFTIDREILHSNKEPHALINSTAHPNSGIWGFIPDEEEAWIARPSELERYNLQHKTSSRIPLPFNPMRIFKDSQGKIWAGGLAEVGVYDPQTKIFKQVTVFPDVRANIFLEDKHENIWVGTDVGLFRYALQTGQLDVFKHNPANPKSLSSNWIQYMTIDKEGTLWLATKSGLNKMIPGTEQDEPKFVHWQSSNSGLPRDDVNCVIDGGDGTLWLSCGNIISHFFPQTGKFRNYDYHDGLTGQTLREGLRSNKGEIYFLSVGDPTKFFPDSLQDNPNTPPVVVTSFSIQNQAVPIRGSYEDTLSWETPLTHAISYMDKMELTYQQNDFSLEFAALNFVNPENNLYKYKLEPYETEWIETTASNRIARYTNLDPGKYTFRVIGSNNDGLWNEEGRSLSIIIHPPWWQTGWAYTLYGLLALGTLLSIRRYEIKRIKLRQRATHLAEVDTLKTRFFANISHEFRTPLTLILGPVKKLRDMYAVPEAQPYLNGIQRNAQRLLHLVNQLLDLSKLEAGKLKLEAVKSDIVAFLKARAHAFSSLAEHKHIYFGVQLPEEKIGVYFDRDKLEKIINNLLSNAFKFTEEEGFVTLKGQAITQGNKTWFQIQVADSGKGIPAEEITKIYDRFYQVDSSQTREQEGSGIGLALTKELVELHHGTLQVESKAGKGTTFTLWLPLGKAHLEEAEIIQELPLPEEETALNEPKLHPSDLMSYPQENFLHEEEGTDQVSEKPVVLIVEDHQEVRKFIRDSIGEQYQVKEAENGKTGVTMAKEFLPDLIISDVMMPQMDGYQLCERVKTDELTSHIPVILLTAKADRRSKLTGLETGADDYLAKPFDAEELQLIIRNRIEERRKMRERFSKDITLEPRSISVTSLDAQFLNKVLDIIEAHMDDENFTIEALSQEVGYSHMNFYRKLKALSGQTPSQFVRTVRLKRAAALLQQKSDHVIQIAYSVGFGNVSYFNKCFKDQFGMTPTQFAAEAQA